MRQVIALILSMIIISVSASATHLIPLRDFFRNPKTTFFQISPDGKHLSFEKSYNHRLNVFVQPINGGEAKRVTAETDRDILDYFWKGNDHIAYLKDFDGDENYYLVLAKCDGTEVEDLTPFKDVRTQIIDQMRWSDDELIIGLNKRNREIFDAYKINIKTGKLTLIAENPGNIAGWVGDSSWLADHEGRIRVAVAYDGSNKSILYRENENQPWKTIITTNFREEVLPIAFTFDNRMLYASSNIGRDKSALVVIDPATGKETELLYENPDVDVVTLGFSRLRKVITVAAFTTWKIERYFFDQQTRALYGTLAEKLPGYEIEIQGKNRAEDMFIVLAFNDRTAGTYYLYQTRGEKLTKLANVMPWLDEKKLSVMKPIRYKARDGLIIQGYLTLPHGVVPQNLPLVVHPHGGPWARDEWGFSPTVQFLANRGYAVLQMNFRGSTGYGRKFWEASFKQWGKKMQDDISDGVKYVVSQGIVNPQRVCIFGGSYGGYATLAGLAFTPDLYACGIDFVGISNLFTWFKTIPPYWKGERNVFHEMIGDPEKDKELFIEVSPVFHADKIRVPLLIAQGAKDPRVNINESSQMVEALRKRGIDVPYIVKENEGHGFSNEENRIEFNEAMEKFLAKYLMPRHNHFRHGPQAAPQSHDEYQKSGQPQQPSSDL